MLSQAYAPILVLLVIVAYLKSRRNRTSHNVSRRVPNLVLLRLNRCIFRLCGISYSAAYLRYNNPDPPLGASQSTPQ